MNEISSPTDFSATDPYEVVMTRRRLLWAAGAFGASTLLVGAAANEAFAATTKKKTTKTTTRTTATTKASAASSSSAANGTCSVIPQETGGPFPGDGTNGVNILTQNGVVRKDLRSSFGSMSGTAKGVPLTLNLSMRSVIAGCAPFTGVAVYAWHCDAIGQYSLYSITTENYCRGVQSADANGLVSFTTIFPGAYSGRWPHIHFEVYSSVAQATSGRNAIATSQVALPESTSKLVYATADYPGSARNLAATPLTSDMVFSDGWQSEMATVTGDVANGFVANLTVNI